MLDYHYSFFFFYYYQIMRCFNLCQIFLPEPNAIVNQWIIFGLFLVDCPRYRRITPLSGGDRLHSLNLKLVKLLENESKHQAQRLHAVQMSPTDPHDYCGRFFGRCRCRGLLFRR